MDRVHGLGMEAVVAHNIEIVLLLLLIWHYLLGLLLLEGRRRIKLLGTCQVLDRSHQERRLHVSIGRVVVLRLTGQHVLGKLLVVLLLLLLLSSLLCLILSVHVVVLTMLILAKVVFAPVLAHVADLLVTAGLDEVLEHLGKIVLLRRAIADQVGATAVLLKCLVQHGLREALALEAGVVRAILLHV